MDFSLLVVFCQAYQDIVILLILCTSYFVIICNDCVRRTGIDHYFSRGVDVTRQNENRALEGLMAPQA